MRLVILLTALLSALTVMPVAAGAVTWHNDGDTAFTATGGATSLSTGPTTLTCTSLNATGVTPVGPIVGPEYEALTGTITGTGCMLNGIPAGLDCNFTLTATQVIGIVATGTSGMTCGVYQAGTKVCHLETRRPAEYSVPPFNTGLFTAPTSSTGTGTDATTPCPLRGKLHWYHMFLRVTAGTGGPSPHNGPNIKRTA